MEKIVVRISINGHTRYYGGVWTEETASVFARKENERLAACGSSARVEVLKV